MLVRVLTPDGRACADGQGHHVESWRRAERLVCGEAGERARDVLVGEPVALPTPLAPCTRAATHLLVSIRADADGKSGGARRSMPWRLRRRVLLRTACV
jgi:hypothetical protein